MRVRRAHEKGLEPPLVRHPKAQKGRWLLKGWLDHPILQRLEFITVVLVAAELFVIFRRFKDGNIGIRQAKFIHLPLQCEGTLNGRFRNAEIGRDLCLVQFPVLCLHFDNTLPISVSFVWRIEKVNFQLLAKHFLHTLKVFGIRNQRHEIQPEARPQDDLTAVKQAIRGDNDARNPVTHQIAKRKRIVNVPIDCCAGELPDLVHRRSASMAVKIASVILEAASGPSTLIACQQL